MLSDPNSRCAPPPHSPPSMPFPIHRVAERLRTNTITALSLGGGSGGVGSVTLAAAKHLRYPLSTCTSLTHLTINTTCLSTPSVMRSLLQAASASPRLRCITVTGGLTILEGRAISEALAEFRLKCHRRCSRAVRSGATSRTASSFSSASTCRTPRTPPLPQPPAAMVASPRVAFGGLAWRLQDEREWRDPCLGAASQDCGCGGAARRADPNAWTPISQKPAVQVSLLPSHLDEPTARVLAAGISSSDRITEAEVRLQIAAPPHSSDWQACKSLNARLKAICARNASHMTPPSTPPHPVLPNRRLPPLPSSRHSQHQQQKTREPLPRPRASGLHRADPQPPSRAVDNPPPPPRHLHLITQSDFHRKAQQNSPRLSSRQLTPPSRRYSPPQWNNRNPRGRGGATQADKQTQHQQARRQPPAVTPPSSDSGGCRHLLLRTHTRPGITGARHHAYPAPRTPSLSSGGATSCTRGTSTSTTTTPSPSPRRPSTPPRCEGHASAPLFRRDAVHVAAPWTRHHHQQQQQQDWQRGENQRDEESRPAVTAASSRYGDGGGGGDIGDHRPLRHADRAPRPPRTPPAPWSPRERTPDAPCARDFTPPWTPRLLPAAYPSPRTPLPRPCRGSSKETTRPRTPLPEPCTSQKGCFVCSLDRASATEADSVHRVDEALYFKRRGQQQQPPRPPTQEEAVSLHSPTSERRRVRRCDPAPRSSPPPGPPETVVAKSDNREDPSTAGDAVAGVSNSSSSSREARRLESQTRTAIYRSGRHQPPDGEREPVQPAASRQSELASPPPSERSAGNDAQHTISMEDILRAAEQTARQLERRAYPLLSTPPQVRSSRGAVLADLRGGADRDPSPSNTEPRDSKTAASPPSPQALCATADADGCDSPYTSSSDSSSPADKAATTTTTTTTTTATTTTAIAALANDRDGGGRGARSPVREYPSLEPTPRFTPAAGTDEAPLFLLALPAAGQGTASPRYSRPAAAGRRCPAAEEDRCVNEEDDGGVYLVSARAWRALQRCVTALQQDVQDYRSRVGEDTAQLQVRIGAANRVFAHETTAHLAGMKAAMEGAVCSARGAT